MAAHSSEQPRLAPVPLGLRIIESLTLVLLALMVLLVAFK